MALIEGLNYVESNIRQEILQVETPDNTANATLVIGTSRGGKTGVLTKITAQDARDKFANVPNGSDFETDLVHAALAIQASTAARDKEMYAFKVGDSQAARLGLFENQVFLTGDLSFSLDEDGNPIEGMFFEARNENEQDNLTTVQVRGDDSGIPTSMVVTLPDGFTRVFTMDPFGTRPGVSSDIEALVNEINTEPQIADRYEVGFNILRKSNLEVTVEDGVNPFIEVGPAPTVSNESWGDKLVDIEELKELVTETEILESGKISQKLNFTPIKDSDPDTVTITSFSKIVEDEVVKTAGVADVGKTDVTESLALTSASLAWDKDDGSITDVVVEYTHNGETVEIAATEYTITDGVIDIDLPEAMDLNDKVVVSYKFGANLVEANVRSELITGNENSYFIIGDSIVFGAAPSLEIELTYDATKLFDPSDINIADRRTIRIEFINSENAPAPGASVFITFTYLPELPAVSGSIVKGDTKDFVQGSALKGGTSGSLITKQRYRDLVEEALDVTSLTPFRRVIVAGAFLDDFVDGLDQETGLPGQVNLSWADLLATKLDFKSRTSQEVSTVIGVKPITPERLARGESGINEWVEELLETLDDQFTPAAQIAALNSFHIDTALGVPFVSDSAILGGGGYIENPAYIVCGMQLDNPLTQSLIKAPVPGFVKRLLVTFPSGQLVGRLNTAHYTTLVVNPRGDLRISDAPTSSDDRLPLARQLVRDTVFATLKIARDIAEQFIGLRRDARTLGMMQARINRDVSRAMINQVPQFLTFFNAEILPTPGGFITGDTRMRLTMETSVEIRRITFESSVKLGGQEL